MHKKAQGISLETIVVAVIVLFVLAVLLLVFTGRINVFGMGLKECSTIQGTCRLSNPGCDAEGRAALYGGRCLKSGTTDTDPSQVCCSIALNQANPT